MNFLEFPGVEWLTARYPNVILQYSKHGKSYPLKFFTKTFQLANSILESAEHVSNCARSTFLFLLVLIAAFFQFSNALDDYCHSWFAWIPFGLMFWTKLTNTGAHQHCPLVEPSQFWLELITSFNSGHYFAIS